MQKLNDEELSKVLTAHAVGGLVQGGSPSWTETGYPGCLSEIVFESFGVASIQPHYERDRALKMAYWFDVNYDANWTVDRFLVELEGVGLA
jgi:hypothetical protein